MQSSVGLRAHLNAEGGTSRALLRLINNYTIDDPFHAMDFCAAIAPTIV